MRNISEIVAKCDAANNPCSVVMPPIETSKTALVVFDDVLDPKKVLNSPEIETLVKEFHGTNTISLLDPENKDELQDWLRDEIYRANDSMIYHVETSFDEFVVADYDYKFSGPLNVIILCPGGTKYYLVLTCRWGDGLFRRDYSVIGVIGEWLTVPA